VGVIGGVYIGHDHEAQAQDVQASLVVQTDADETQLLKDRQSQHAAARAYQREAEDDAAAEAATAAKAAASKAHTLEKKVIAQKAADMGAAAAKKSESTSTGTGTGTGTVPYTGPIPTSCNSYSGNHATGCALMLDAGFKIDQFPCLDKLWNRESGWNAHAANSSTGAYGIPQALPGDKMASVASDWKTNPATQIKWGLGYIEGRYSTPCGAWSHSESTGWY
jgi:hypothetical protein